MARRNQHKATGATKLKLPARAISDLKKLGFGPELQMMNKILKGETWPEPEVDRLCPPVGKLNGAFDTISPSLSPELSGDFVSRCWSCMLYVSSLSEHLGELARLNKRSSPGDLRTLLAVVYECDLWGLRRQVNGLRRDIVRLIEELGGDPSEELLLPRKRAARKRNTSTLR